jgi:hypothetical protein
VHEEPAPGELRLGDEVLRQDQLVTRDRVLAWHAAGLIWDTAQGWFVNPHVALKPTAGGYRVVDLTRLRDEEA